MNEADPDGALVEQFRLGDSAAFDSLVRKYQRPIYYLAFRYLKNDADAEDVAQRAFVQAFQRFASYRRESAFKAWLYRIAINLALNAIRDGLRRRPLSATGSRPAEASPPEVLVEAEERRRLRTAIEKLPPKQRMVVELRIFEELSFKEVAEVVDSSEDSAKVNYHHALKRLRALLAEAES